MVGCEPGGQHSFHDIVRGARGERHGDLEADFADAIREHEEPMEGFLDGLRGYPDRGPFAYRIIPIGFEEVVGAAIRFVDQTELRLLKERAETAQEEAGDVERTRAQFVTNTSHELRTPLNGILGMTNLLQDTRLSSEQREFVEIIQTSGENLLSLVNGILDFSKFEAGRFELERDLVFRRSLNVVTLATKVASPGDFVTADVVGTPVVIVRGDDGELRAFLNVCRHRGATVETRAEGHCKRFVCPYHAWTYNTDGSLHKVRHPEGFPSLKSKLPTTSRNRLSYCCVKTSRSPRPNSSSIAMIATCSSARSFANFAIEVPSRMSEG